MSEIKLLPCPFCGGEAYLYEDKKCDIYSVGCKNCCDIEPITRVCESKEEAIKLWNTRKPMQDIVERLEEEKIADIASYDFYREKGNEKMQCSYAGKINAYKDAIEIVKGVINERD